jgi:hypothetical protein
MRELASHHGFTADAAYDDRGVVRLVRSLGDAR